MFSIQLTSLLEINFNAVNTTKNINGNLILCLNIRSPTLLELEKQGVQTHKAIEYKNDANLSVMLLSYIEGTPADELIKNLSDMEQFTIDLAAGKE